MAVSVPHRASVPRRARRWTAASVATTCLATVLVVAPTPRVVSAAALELQTEHVVLRHRGEARTGDAVGVASLATAEAAELRGALRSVDRRATPVRTDRTLAVGVTLPAAPEGPLLVRGRVGGRWTPWFELPFASGEGPDADDGTRGRPGTHSEPVWLGDADAYQLDAPDDVTELDVHRIGDGPAHRELVVAEPSAAAATAPSIQPRAAWGARPPTRPPETTADLKLAIVHHTVSGNTYSPAQVPQIIRSVQAYHQGVQGYTDIAYNVVVDKFGRAWEGRAGGLTNVGVGGHSQGFNTGSLGVVVLGDFRTATPSSATVETVARVIAWKLALHRVDPASTVRFTSAGSAKYERGRTVTLPRIVGHRDVQATDCPGGNLYARLGAIRARVAQLVPAYQAGLAPTMLGPDVTGDGLIDPIQYQPGRTADAQWASSAGALTRRPASINGAFRPAVGDFDGNGQTDVVWHASGSAADYVWWSGPSGTTSRPATVNGSYVPIPGDFDGNGVEDILWYATGIAPDSVWYFRPDRSYVARAVTQDLITGVPVVGDFDGDQIDDVLFYGPGPVADDWLWRGNHNRTFRVTHPTVDGWYVPAALDATGDGQDEIVWHAPGATRSYRWDFRPDGSATSRALTTAALVGPPVVGDFDGDGLEDLLLAAAGPAADAVWYSTPTGIDPRPVTMAGSYSTVAGPMDVAATEPATDDVLFVSATGTDFLWRGRPDRLFSSLPVG